MKNLSFSDKFHFKIGKGNLKISFFFPKAFERARKGKINGTFFNSPTLIQHDYVNKIYFVCFVLVLKIIP